MKTILNSLNPRDLLAASAVSKYWRDVSLPMISDSVFLVIRSMDDAIKVLENTTVCYQHFSFVSYLSLKFKTDIW